MKQTELERGIMSVSSPSSDPSRGDEESLSSGMQRTVARRGGYLKDDPGWMGTFNSIVWRSPNIILYAVLVLGTCVFCVLQQSGYSTGQFLGAAVVEVLLSTDNICLFHKILDHFRVQKEVRPGLLFVGAPLMVIIRGLLFFMLKGVYEYLKPLMLALGAFCIWQGAFVLYQTFNSEEADDDDDPAKSALVRWAKRALGDRMLDKYHGSAFFIYTEGLLKITPMLLVMTVIEATDVAFCVDGVSTIFMLDHKQLHVLFVGDVVAACFVRALYPHLAGAVDLFPDLNYSVACILILVGVDMCSGVLAHEFPPGFLALSTALLFGVGIATSLRRKRSRDP